MNHTLRNYYEQQINIIRGVFRLSRQLSEILYASGKKILRESHSHCIDERIFLQKLCDPWESSKRLPLIGSRAPRLKIYDSG